MGEEQEITCVEKCDLMGIVAELFAEGYRLVQIGCTTLPAGYELTYSFDREYRLRHLRFAVPPAVEVPSIGVIYPNAFLYENEIHDLFGVSVAHLTVDYRGTLYRTSIPTPFDVGKVRFPTPPAEKG